MKDDARPIDIFLFHPNSEELIDKSKAQTIASWIISNKSQRPF